MSTKICKKCQIEKPIERFSKKTASKDGYLNQCKDCLNEYHNKYRSTPEQKEKKRIWSKDYLQRKFKERKAYATKWRHDNPEMGLLVKARHRAKTKGLEYNLTIEDVTIPEYCPILGIKLERNLNGNGPIMTSPTLDRINNSEGYIKGNVRVISFRANALRNDATLYEMKLILKDMEENERNKS